MPPLGSQTGDSGSIVPVRLYQPTPAITARSNKWSFAGCLLDNLVWSEEEWAALPELDRPVGAAPLRGGGWSLIRYAERG